MVPPGPLPVLDHWNKLLLAHASLMRSRLVSQLFTEQITGNLCEMHHSSQTPMFFKSFLHFS